MTEYYIDAENGSDTNDGTSVTDAFATFAPINAGGKAELAPGDTLYLRGNAQHDAVMLNLKQQGDTGDDQILITNYQDERPLIDGDVNNLQRGAHFNGVQNCRVEHIDIENAQTHGIEIHDGGGYGTAGLEFHDVRSHHNGLGGTNGGGFAVRDSGTTDVLFDQCVSHQNQAGGNSDGWNINVGASGVTCRDCLSWHDQDDGYDTNRSGGDCEFIRCIAAYPGRDVNMNDTGNGCGFKTQQGEGGHYLERCIAYGCTRWSFKDWTENNPNTFYHCVAWDGENTGFMHGGADFVSEYVNCIAYQNTSPTSFRDDVAQPNDHHNTWNLGITNPQFQDTTLDERHCPKNENFLRPEQDSPVVGAGTDVGVPHTGDNPDIGAYEYRPQDSAGASLKYFDSSSWQAAKSTAVYGNQDSSSASLKYFDSSSWQAVDTDVTFRTP